MQNLPENLYSVDSIVRIEQTAINQFGIPAVELMTRAGKAVFDVIKNNELKHKNILVLCGAGNNAGDGYVVAKLAKQAGLNVSVISMIDPLTLKNEAALAYQQWLTVGVNITLEALIGGELLETSDIVVDALLGTGLTRDVSADWQHWIALINKSDVPVVAVDIPSGLIADTGAIAGAAIKAEFTVCFIGLKKGMFTAQAKDVCGEIIFDDLNLTDDVYTSAKVEVDARLISATDYSLLPERKASSNKGNFGHVLIVGGNRDMPGAIILAATAALRTGAGLVTIVTVAENLSAISLAVPEVMVKTCEKDNISDVITESFIAGITHIAIGMGLGQDDWSLALLSYCAGLNKPMLIDADALNLLATNKIEIKSSVVITPHPGEAARLLSSVSRLNSADIQRNRFASVKQLHGLFAGSESCLVILKGSGSLIFDGHSLKVCSLGNAAMAAPGMGDVLSGIVIALMAQGINISDAAELAVCLHASAAGIVSGDNTRGLLASDVVDVLPDVLQCPPGKN